MPEPKSGDPNRPGKEESRKFAWKRILQRAILYAIVIAAALLFFNKQVEGNENHGPCLSTLAV